MNSTPNLAIDPSAPSRCTDRIGHWSKPWAESIIELSSLTQMFLLEIFWSRMVVFWQLLIGSVLDGILNIGSIQGGQTAIFDLHKCGLTNGMKSCMCIPANFWLKVSLIQYILACRIALYGMSLISKDTTWNDFRIPHYLISDSTWTPLLLHVGTAWFNRSSAESCWNETPSSRPQLYRCSRLMGSCTITPWRIRT